MHHARRIRFIPAAMPLVHSSVGAPAMAQQDEAALVSKRALELHQVSKFFEAMPLAQRALAIQENAFGPDHPGARAMAGLPSLVRSLPKQRTDSADWVVVSACTTVAADKPGVGAPSGLARASFDAVRGRFSSRTGRSTQRWPPDSLRLS
jgi:hypothetical protein